MEREEKYRSLVIRRKKCVACKQALDNEEIYNPAIYYEGKYDSDELGPWARWQGNIYAELLIVGQDWGGTDDLHYNNGCEPPDNPTNKSVAKYLRKIGYKIDEPPISYDDCGGKFGRSGSVFLTNGILCIKYGDIQTDVKDKWFDMCGVQFLRPTIELVSPYLVVTLGAKAARGIQTSYHFPKKELSELISKKFPFQLKDHTFWLPLYHPSWKTWRYRDRNLQEADWERIGHILKDIKSEWQRI